MAKKQSGWKVLVIVLAVAGGIWLLVKGMLNKPVTAPASGTASDSGTAAAAGILGFGSAIAGLFGGGSSSSSAINSGTSFLNGIFGTGSGSDISSYFAGGGMDGGSELDPIDSGNMLTEFDSLV